MVTVASDNLFPSVLFDETTAPATPAAGTQRLFVDTADGLLKLKDDAGAVTTVGGGLSDPMTTRGDIIIRNASNVTARLGRGGAGTYLGSDGTDLSWSTPGASVYNPPLLSNANGNYAASGTSVVVTMTAPTAGDNLVAIVYSTGRTCNSITQTNVAWTQRYTSNGNSQWLEVWTGVVSASAGTTATAAFTGSNKQYMETFVLPGVTPFTSATVIGAPVTGTTALMKISCAPAAAGDYVIWAASANSPTDSYSGLSCPYTASPQSWNGGAGRSGIFRAQPNLFVAAWSLSSGAANFQTAFIKVS